MPYSLTVYDAEKYRYVTPLTMLSTTRRQLLSVSHTLWVPLSFVRFFVNRV